MIRESWWIVEDCVECGARSFGRVLCHDCNGGSDDEE